MRTRGGEEGGVIEKQQTKRLHEMLMRVLIVSPDNETNRPWVKVKREHYETMRLKNFSWTYPGTNSVSPHP